MSAASLDYLWPGWPRSKSAAALSSKLRKASMSAVSTESAYVGRVDEACYVVPVVDERPPDAVELCMGDPGGVVLLRERLRQLNEQAVGMSGWCFALPSD